VVTQAQELMAEAVGAEHAFGTDPVRVVAD
jgi:hypothetical protein